MSASCGACLTVLRGGSGLYVRLIFRVIYHIMPNRMCFPFHSLPLLFFVVRVESTIDYNDIHLSRKPNVDPEE